METKNTLKTLPALTRAKRLYHIKKMRVRFASNQAAILRELELTELDYELQFLEVGCQFLEQIYDRNKKNQNVWYNKLSKDNKYIFWKWFKVEFKVLENDFVNVLIGGNVQLDKEDWNDFLNGIPHDQLLEKSLSHFITRMPYVKL